MRSCWLTREGHDVCLLFFSGWGIDYRPFLSIRPKNFDLLVLHDYRDLTIDNLDVLLAPYRRRCLAAWSLGVWVAARVLSGYDISFVRQTAIGGTLCPIDNRYGIPLERYRAATVALSKESLDQFYADMFTESHHLERFLRHRPAVSLAGLRRELAVLEEAIRSSEAVPDRYSDRIVLLRDRIFPVRNQVRSWGKENCITLRCGHFPFYDWGGFERFLDQ